MLPSMIFIVVSLSNNRNDNGVSTAQILSLHGGVGAVLNQAAVSGQRRLPAVATMVTVAAVAA